MTVTDARFARDCYRLLQLLPVSIVMLFGIGGLVTENIRLKIALTVIITLLVAFGAVWGFGKISKRVSMPVQTGPIAVRAETAAVGDLVEIVSAPGTVQPRTKVSISARVSARIVELPHKEGESVSKGDANANPPKPPSLLVRLDSKDLQASLRSAKARFAAQQSSVKVDESHIAAQESSIAAAKFSLADAERDLNRQKGLLATNDVSQSVVDTAQSKFDGLKAQLEATFQNLVGEKANLDVLKHNLEAAEAEISKAEEDLANTVITSPIDGVVIKLNNEVGEMVVVGITNSPGSTIMEVADLNQMLFVAKVDESSIARVKVGQKATVRIPAYADESFEGTVDTVALSNTDDKDGTKYFKAEILLKTNGRRIPSGLTADADIETKRHEKVITVPSQSILGRPADDLPEPQRSKPEVDKSKALATVVYKIVNGKAVATPVTVGPSNATHTVVKSGLTGGERIISGPFKILDTLANEMQVNAPAASQPSTNPSAAPQKPSSDPGTINGGGTVILQ
jgi:HlyD family secretion protein